MGFTRRFLLKAALAGTALAGGFTAGHAAEPRTGGDLVIVSTQVPRHLNPAVQSGLATALPGTQIFASPLKYDENWEPHPYLAKSWEWSDDGLSLTLNLEENAKFHDGEPVTSEDVEFSLLTIKQHHPFSSLFAPVEAVDTPDPHTAVIRLSQPHPALLLALSTALSPIIPKHVYGDGQDIPTHPANSQTVGSGPFKLAEFRPGEQITLERFDDFFIEGRPYLDRLIIRIVPDPASVLLTAESGEADLVPFSTDSQSYQRLDAIERFEVTSQGYEGIGPITWLAYNTVKAPLDDVKVRQAIAYATDREFITKALHRGISNPQRSPIIESNPFFNPDIAAYDTDLDKANALLDEAGLEPGADGNRFTLTVDYLPGGGEQSQNIAEYLRSQLPKIGIGVEVRASPDFPTWAQRISGGDFDLTLDTVFNWGDPVIGVHRSYLSSNIRPGIIWSNTQGYANPKVDELLNAAAVETDPAQRKALYDEFQILVGEELPVYWINAVPYHTAYDKRLANVPLSIWGPLQSFDEVYWSEDR